MDIWFELYAGEITEETDELGNKYSQPKWVPVKGAGCVKFDTRSEMWKNFSIRQIQNAFSDQLKKVIKVIETEIKNGED